MARYVFPLFAPFIIALILAAIIDPVVELVTRHFRFNRGACVFLCLLIVLILLSIIIALSIVRIISEVQDFYRALPIYNMNLEEILSNMISYVKGVTEGLPDSVTEAVRRVQSTLYTGLERLLLGMTGFIGSLPRLSINIIVSFFAAFFISRDKRQISEFLVSLTPLKWRKKAKMARAGVVSATLGFIRAYLILISVTIIVSIIGFTIAQVSTFGYSELLQAF